MPGWQITKRFTGLPLVAGGTDIVANAPVTLSKPVSGASAWGVLPVTASNVGPIVGVTRASAINGQAITVYDIGDIHQAQLAGGGASVVAGEFVGVLKASTATGGSGNIVVPMVTVVERASAKTVYAIGQAIENALPGNKFAYYLNPTQLSGLT